MKIDYCIFNNYFMIDLKANTELKLVHGGKWLNLNHTLIKS